MKETVSELIKTDMKSDKFGKALPELLAPAGSARALDAAIDAGADAVYFGASAFNARIGAKNFVWDELSDAFERCHAYGVRAYVTLNTLVLDREMGEYLGTAEKLWRLGADAFIVADLGGAAVLRRYLPEAELHASTQMSGHNTYAAKVLHDLGFSRMVLARETSLENIKTFTKNSPIEAEIFIHGALCVSHSGQCLFSSIVGGRSGNRGECAQPCRLPYARGNSYPLSLKDLCLAAHIPSIIDSGAASLKIEGRMKSAEYVHAVTSVYRRLLDERRGADAKEIEYLSSVFSRGGFTDGYFTGKIGRGMLGVRSDEDKEKTRALETFDKIKRKRPVNIRAVFCPDEPSKLTMSSDGKEVTVSGDVPMAAINAPMTYESVRTSLAKLGDTPFFLDSADIDIRGKLMLPASKLNALRRAAVAALIGKAKRDVPEIQYKSIDKLSADKGCLSARFVSADTVTDKARSFFDRIYLPLKAFDGSVNGVIIPPVVFDGEIDEVSKKLKKAKEMGAKYALVGNLGHIEFAKEAGLVPVGDFRLNIFNRESAAQAEALGFEEYILSPELTLAQIRDIGGKSAVIVCGRLPLMLLEKCAIKEISSCEACSKGSVSLTDRMGKSFPVIREWEHRNVIYNSLPTYMGDKKQILSKFGVSGKHFIFSDEGREEVDEIIYAYEAGRSPKGIVRRIKE
ncbi:MAG: U32 family peptidase [Clostridia bacterium]|nr:U32 family peptidase [Clostridia bacterium]